MGQNEVINDIIRWFEEKEISGIHGDKDQKNKGYKGTIFFWHGKEEPKGRDYQPWIFTPMKDNNISRGVIIFRHNLSENASQSYDEYIENLKKRLTVSQQREKFKTIVEKATADDSLLKNAIFRVECKPANNEEISLNDPNVIDILQKWVLRHDGQTRLLWIDIRIRASIRPDIFENPEKQPSFICEFIEKTIPFYNFFYARQKEPILRSPSTRDAISPPTQIKEISDGSSNQEIEARILKYFREKDHHSIDDAVRYIQSRFDQEAPGDEFIKSVIRKHF